MEYTEEIKKHIASEIMHAFHSLKFQKNRKNLVLFKNSVQEWLDAAHEQELCPKFNVGFKKLPRKLKKKYKEKGKVFLEFTEQTEMETIKLEIETKE